MQQHTASFGKPRVGDAHKAANAATRWRLQQRAGARPTAEVGHGVARGREQLSTMRGLRLQEQTPFHDAAWLAVSRLPNLVCTRGDFSTIFDQLGASIIALQAPPCYADVEADQKWPETERGCQRCEAGRQMPTSRGSSDETQAHNSNRSESSRSSFREHEADPGRL